VLFIHNLRLVPLEQQTTRFRKALAQKAFALDTVGSFAVNFDFLDFTSMSMCSFAVNFDFLDFTFPIFTKGKRLYRSRYYLAVLRQPPFNANHQ
jgi:hypothetical protein